MPVLKNTKWEKFVTGIIGGLKPAESYVNAGFSKTGARGAASRLLANVSVRERLKELSTRVTEGVVLKEIGKRNDRLAAQNERWHLMRQVISERAAEYAEQKDQGKKIPAGSITGLLVRTAKSLGSGANAKVIIEYEVDTGLLREIRAIEQHSAQELGQWTEKSESLVRFPDLKTATDDELLRIAADLGAEEGFDARDPAGVRQASATT